MFHDVEVFRVPRLIEDESVDLRVQIFPTKLPLPTDFPCDTGKPRTCLAVAVSFEQDLSYQFEEEVLFLTRMELVDALREESRQRNVRGSQAQGIGFGDWKEFGDIPPEDCPIDFYEIGSDAREHIELTVELLGAAAMALGAERVTESIESE